jgi:hypothetical protein
LQAIRERWLARGKPAWWLEPNMRRTEEFSHLFYYVRAFVPMELTPEDVLAQPIVYDELFRHWRVCQQCVEGSAPGCPQRMISTHIRMAYLSLREIGGQRVFAMRQCPGKENRKEEIREAWGLPMTRGGITGTEVRETAP